jgi:hypothetical protein
MATPLRDGGARPVTAYWIDHDPNPGYDPADIADTLDWPCDPEFEPRPVTDLPDISTWQETPRA